MFATVQLAPILCDQHFTGAGCCVKEVHTQKILFTLASTGLMCAALNRRVIFYNVYYDADTLSEFTASGKMKRWQRRNANIYHWDVRRLEYYICIFYGFIFLLHSLRWVCVWNAHRLILCAGFEWKEIDVNGLCVCVRGVSQGARSKMDGKQYHLIHFSLSASPFVPDF